jgi:pilus assembly protein CpaF
MNMWQIKKPSRVPVVEDEEQRQRVLQEHRLVTVGDAGAFAKRDKNTELKVELHQRLIDLINLQSATSSRRN